jgi:hypothetical protein
MEKNKFNNFINKYNLGGEVESVNIVSDGSTLSVGMISDDKSMLGKVRLDNITFPTGEFGIYTTSQLKQLLSVLQEDVNVEATDSSLIFSDSGTTVNYMLASKSVIPSVPDLKQLPNFDIEIKLDSTFVDKFIKSQNALSDITTFAFISEKGKSKIVLGYSTINSNRISINVDATTNGDVKPIMFSAKYLKSVFTANKDIENSTMKISTDGLLYVDFQSNGFNSEYYIVESKQ